MACGKRYNTFLQLVWEGNHVSVLAADIACFPLRRLEDHMSGSGAFALP